MNYQLALKVFRNNWYNPSWWRNFVYPFLKRNVVMNLLKPYYAMTADGSNFMDEDWDNLIILDACRYDIFSEYNYLDGSLEERTSLASSTPEFITKTFEQETFYDTVYVTANPQFNLRVDSEVFHHVEQVWETDWDEELSTVHPNTMVKQTKEINENYPNKRVIAHFMQPHYPFIGEIGRSELSEQAGFELTKRLASGEDATRDGESIWDLLERGEVEEDLVWKAYIENLHVVLAEIEELLDALNGRTVVTADHGNLIGESVGPLPIKMYGHPTGIHADPLVTVPWLVVDDEERKEITTERPTERDAEYDTDELEGRLADLGYAD